MSSVTGLAWFSELMLRCLFIWEIFSPVNRDEIQKTKPRWWNILTIIIRDYRSFVDSSDFTIKRNSVRKFLKWKHIQDENNATLASILRKRS